MDEPTDADWQTWTSYQKHEYLGEDRWSTYAATDELAYWEHLPQHPDWVVDVLFSNASRNPEISAIRVAPFGRWPSAADPMSAAVWRSVRPGELLRFAWSRVHVKQVHAELERIDEPNSSVRPRKSLSKQARDREYAIWARRYVEVLHAPDPVRQLADTYHLSVSRIRNLLWEARKRHLLTKPTHPGRPGGKLTAQAAKELLDGEH